MPVRTAAAVVGVPRELAAPAPTMQVNPVSILRGLMRNWWKILGLWLITSLPAVYLIYSQIRPTYNAYSVIRIQSNHPDLFGSGTTLKVVDRNIETEIQHIKTDSVLSAALGDPTVADLPFLKDNPSAVSALKAKLSIQNEKNTDYVRVALDSTDPVEAAALVNAVVNAYMESYKTYQEGSNVLLRKKLQQYLDDTAKEKRGKTDELNALMDKGTITLKNLNSSSTETEKAASATKKAFGDEPPAAQSINDVSFEQFRKYKDRLLETRVALFKAKAELSQRTGDFQNADEIADVAAEGAVPSGAELESRIKAEFLSDPAIAELYEQKRDMKQRLDHVEKGARKGSDPARRAHRDAVAGIQARIDEFWEERYHEIRGRILEGGPSNLAEAPKAAGAPRNVQELKAEVAQLEHDQAAILAVLNEAQIETQRSNSDTYKAQFLQAEIDSMTNDQAIVRRKLQDLDFVTGKDAIRVEVTDRAAVPRLASDGKRVKLMAAAPLVLMLLLLGVFSLLEIRAERVGDPDALSSRVQSEVYSLPPIPMARSQRRLGAPGEDDQIDRFIQRLDHLRFAVCGDHPEVGLGRCVLISSAVGSEGKTTLAAQLAARCGHSGHTTLLIDADLRRGALCPLLDIPEGRGLSDVLTNEDLNVEDVVIPVQGGTFHLLSAGTAVSDTSRIFQGRAFGMLIARLRQLYDLIIIDSPPILPVPDALIMGRWTDGVVLASRYDVSRAPQVERARRQLDLAGIPVLGTVINGMRTSDSYYGRYTYSRQPTGAAADQERPADATSAG
ncbi:polysaccharide biosynthesis tyrosine autokinase [Paludisphaera mucosa]|uniref:AAA family ATPase n=1 Tax=Paludisphaera mucosa TaxID=3030827 RepID=A0ABT6FKN1_9BACT|nr:polysaccharide biosynthesis tyrosine autokinase [Paludisphaera mucosa]MDG3008136.1 AAA family ATPase [Paludisphaera mucosa]